MELVATLAAHPDEAGVLEDVDVLAHGLSGGDAARLHRQAGTQLEQGLAVPLGQCVDDRASSGVSQRPKDITHDAMIGKRSLACQGEASIFGRYSLGVYSGTKDAVGTGGFGMAEQRTIARDEDPVCGMTVEPDAARAKGLTETHEGREYAFCGKGCLLEFRDDPGMYLGAGYTPSM